MKKLYRWLLYGHSDVKMEFRWHEFRKWESLTRLDYKVIEHNPEIKTTYYDKDNRVVGITTIYTMHKN